MNCETQSKKADPEAEKLPGLFGQAVQCRRENTRNAYTL
jgi:hypothetical protein